MAEFVALIQDDRDAIEDYRSKVQDCYDASLVAKTYLENASAKADSAEPFVGTVDGPTLMSTITGNLSTMIDNIQAAAAALPSL